MTLMSAFQRWVEWFRTQHKNCCGYRNGCGRPRKSQLVSHQVVFIMHPRYVQFSGWCSFESRRERGVDECDVKLFMDTLDTILPNRLKGSIGVVRSHELLVFSFRMPVSVDSLCEVEHISRSAISAGILSIKDIKPRVRKEPSPQVRKHNAEFGHVVQFSRSVCDHHQHLFKVDDLITRGYPYFEMFLKATCPDGTPLNVEVCRLEQTSSSLVWHQRFSEFVNLRHYELLSEFISFRNKGTTIFRPIASSEPASPLDISSLFLNTQRRAKTRCRNIVKSIASSFSRCIMCFKEVPAWEPCFAHNYHILTTNDSTCAIAIPIDFSPTIRFQDYGKHWYGVVLGRIVVLSCHLTSHDAESGPGVVMIREVLKFHAKECSLIRAMGHEPITAIGSDVNCSLPPDAEGVTGPLVLKPLKSHTAGMQSLVLGFFQALGVRLANTFGLSYADQLWTRGRKNKRAQIDFNGFSYGVAANCRVVTESLMHLTGSDHRPVLSRFHASLPPSSTYSATARSTLKGWRPCGPDATLSMSTLAFKEGRHIQS